MGFLFGYPDENDLPDLEAGSGRSRGPGSGGAVQESACDCSCGALLSIAALMEDLDDDDLSPDVMEALQCVDTCGMGAMIACLMSAGD